MTKAVNYTPEQETVLADQYGAGMSVDEIATTTGKSVRSVVAKLSQLGLYKSKPAKAGDTQRTTKATLVATIEGRYGVEPGTFADLEKASKATLLELARES